MTHFLSFSLLLIISLCQVNGQEFGSKKQDITSLYKLEERLLPALDAFIFNRESHLKELEDVVRKTSDLRAMSGEGFGEYLGNPLNQFHVVKRFIDDWGNLDDYLKSDTSADDFLSEIKKDQNQIPSKVELEKSLRHLEKSNGIDPEGYRVML